MVSPKKLIERYLQWSGPDDKPSQKIPAPTPSLLEQAVIHESGHTLAAWLSPYVTGIAWVSISLRHDSRTCYEWIRPDPYVPSWGWDMSSIRLAGLAAEFAALDVARSGTSSGDLSGARDALIEALRLGGLSGCPWSDPAAKVQLLDIGQMFRIPPESDLRLAMNLSFAHAYRLIVEHRPQFDRLCQELRENRHLLSEDVAYVLGEGRPWVLRR